jgi:hypothetical protein
MAENALEYLHRNPMMKANWKVGLDVTINAYRSSLDAKRLDSATFGDTLAPENGLYISMVDGFQSHNSSTQSITGKITICIIELFTTF